MSTAVDKVLSDADQRMKKATQALGKELGTLRAGRASPSLVEHILVDYYGTPTPLNQMASISAPEARLLVIQPWDRQALKTVEKALMQSDLGLTPSNDGTVIRLPFPPLSEERRRELVRVVKHKVEEGRVAIRNVRRDALEKLRQMEKDKEMSEDDLHRGQDRLQKLTDAHIAEMDQAGARKEEEVMEV